MLTEQPGREGMVLAAGLFLMDSKDISLGALPCDTAPGEMETNLYPPQIGDQQQTRVRIPPKSNLVNQ